LYFGHLIEPIAHLPMTIAGVCDHFIQRELAKDNSWRSYSTKKTYKAYLKRWIIPQLGQQASFGNQNDGSGVVAAQLAGSEKQLCENPRHSLGPFQSCLPSRTFRPQPDPLSSTGREAAGHTECVHTR